jgi:hypothetical protein
MALRNNHVGVDMRKYVVAVIAAIAYLFPTLGLAGICETAWDGDKIANALSERPSYFSIPLRDKNQKITEITAGQLKAFHDAKYIKL